MTTLSKTDRLGIAFAEGAQLTARQIAARFRVANPYDMVYNLRNIGMNIQLDTRTNSKGETVQFYAVPQKTSRKSRAA
jgi:hypothetical protein